MLRYTLLNKSRIICFSGYEKSSATERYEYKSREKSTREGLEHILKGWVLNYFPILLNSFHFQNVLLLSLVNQNGEWIFLVDITFAMKLKYWCCIGSQIKIIFLHKNDRYLIWCMTYEAFGEITPISGRINWNSH